MANNIIQELESCLTTDEVLAYLKVTPRTIYRLIRSGELPAMRVGRQWRFRRADLDAWLARQAHLGQPRAERL
ncbi:MAG TPA: helix-turn-helix domain-containing protein [Vicinamibacterales bacterium]|jgi:excisionase family DNA binding protein